MRIVKADVRGCGGECTDGHMVLYRWHPDPSELRARLAHGLAHALLVREGWAHSEADALMLTHDFI